MKQALILARMGWLLFIVFYVGLKCYLGKK